MTQIADERSYYTNLIEIMLTTRGVRFSVAESEKRKEIFSIGTIALLSVYLAGGSFFLSILPEVLSSFQTRALSAVSVVASISLLVISLFDFAVGRSVYAEKMLQNAFSITAIMREAERELAKQEPNFDRLAKLSADYELSVGRVGINHTSQDFRLWNLQRRKPKCRLHAAWIWLTSIMLQTLAFTSAMFFQIFLLLFILLSTVGITFFL
jgi:hypothetical protein